MHRKEFHVKAASVANFPVAARRPLRPIVRMARRGKFLKRPLKALPYSRATRADTDGGASFSSAKRWRYTPRFSLTLST